MKIDDLSLALKSCLWICREMTHPLVSGDRVYSSGLAKALADAGVKVTFVAHEGENRVRDPNGAPLNFVGVPGGTFNDKFIAATSPLPVTAGIQGTRNFHRQLSELLKHDYEAIVIDQLGSAWALAPILKWMKARQAKFPDKPNPILVYLAHNYETEVWAGMAREAGGSALRKLMVRRNAQKIAWLEKELVSHSDLVLTITDEDAAAFRAAGNLRLEPTVLTPGYSGKKTLQRKITLVTPRRIVMVGSFKWAPKEENLRQFLSVADRAFAKAGIHFDIIGRVPIPLRTELEPGLKATTLHGFVDDVGTLFRNARMAVVPELIGGGFKLKLLDYLFGRVPVATIRAAAAGMPAGIGEHMLMADDMQTLVELIIKNMDDVEKLDAMQTAAYTMAEAEYRWQVRGQEMKASIEAAVSVVALKAPAQTRL